MGLDFDIFVYPDQISKQLICPICTLVLDNPVQTTSEHLFCENELLEWLTRSNLCPVTHSKLDPTSIKKPSRIITNMLGELTCYCPNKMHGCGWIGPFERRQNHFSSCSFKSSEQYQKDIQERNDQIISLLEKCESVEKDNVKLRQDNEVLQEEIKGLQQKIRVYDAFIEGSSAPIFKTALKDTNNCILTDSSPGEANPTSDARKLNRIRSSYDALCKDEKQSPKSPVKTSIFKK